MGARFDWQYRLVTDGGLPVIGRAFRGADANGPHGEVRAVGVVTEQRTPWWATTVGGDQAALTFTAVKISSARFCRCSAFLMVAFGS